MNMLWPFEKKRKEQPFISISYSTCISTLILRLEVIVFVILQFLTVCDNAHTDPTVTLYVKLEVPTIGLHFLGVA
jgi:hypothetical protein